jgi:hypothetical protein
MTYREYDSKATVQAERLDVDRNVITPDGIVIGHQGQWELHHRDGTVKVVDNEEFQNDWRLSVVPGTTGSGDDPGGPCPDKCHHEHHKHNRHPAQSNR